MKYLKFIVITMLIVIIMFIPVNATTLILPDLPGEYEDYIIVDASYSRGVGGGIVAITFNNLADMFVGTYAEYIEIYSQVQNFKHHSNDILYFNSKSIGNDIMEVNQYDLVGDDWELKQSIDGVDVYRFGNYNADSINYSHILYTSQDVIDLSDGSIFFFKGSWMKAGIIRPILGLIPYLIGFLIVSAGFLKGLQLLFRTLRKV